MNHHETVRPLLPSQHQETEEVASRPGSSAGRAHRFVEFNDGEIIAECTEVETETKNRHRPVLREAASRAYSAGACLVIAKLDRLVRNMPFLSASMKSGVEFVCCDNQHANHLTLHILAAIAQQHSQMISERTKAAMAAAKAKGIPLGSQRPGHWGGREHRSGRVVDPEFCSKLGYE